MLPLKVCWCSHSKAFAGIGALLREISRASFYGFPRDIYRIDQKWKAEKDGKQPLLTSGICAYMSRKKPTVNRNHLVSRFLQGDLPWSSNLPSLKQPFVEVADAHKEQKILVGPPADEVVRICPEANGSWWYNVGIMEIEPHNQIMVICIIAICFYLGGGGRNSNHQNMFSQINLYV